MRVFEYVNEYRRVSVCVLSLPAVPSLLLSPGFAGAASGLQRARKGTFTGEWWVVGWIPHALQGGEGPPQQLREQQALRVLAVIPGPKVRYLIPRPRCTLGEH